MDKPTFPHLKSPLYWLILAVVSCYVLALFLSPVPRHAGINDHPEAKFHDMVFGTAGKPHVTRVLLPWTLRALEVLTPSAVENNIEGWVNGNPHVKWLFNRLHWSTGDASLYFPTVLFLWISFFGFAHNTTLLTILATPVRASATSGIVLSCATLLGLPPFFRFTSFIYDPIQLLLFSSCFLAVLNRRFKNFLVLFALACLNKETSILLIPVWILTARPGNKSVASEGVTLTMAFLLSRLLVYTSTQAAPGRFLELHLFDHNIQWLVKGYSFTEFAAACGAVFLLLWAWREKNETLKKALICVLPPLLMAGMIFGYVDEWRGYYEAYPVGFALIVDSWVRLNSLQNSSGDCRV